MSNEITQPSRLTLKEKIDISLKQYDSLRKEIDDRLNAPKLYFLPLLIALSGAVLGKSVGINTNLILLYCLPFLTVFLGFTVSSGFIIQRTGVQIAKIEDKLFNLSGEAFLTHETEMLMQRKKTHYLWWCGSLVTVLVIYCLTEFYLMNSLDIASISDFTKYPGRKWVVYLLLAVPLLVFLIPTVKMIWLYKRLRTFDSSLLKKLSELPGTNDIELSNSVEPPIDPQ